MAEEATLDAEPVVAPEIKSAAAPAAKATPEPIVGKSEADPGAAPPAKVVESDWRDDWRDKIADAKHKKTMDRFASPKDLANAYFSLTQRLSSGELKAVVPFPAKGTAEEQAAWRKDQGLPEAADKYDLKFDDGLVIGENDKPIVDAFLKAAHEANMPAAGVKTAVSWYFKAQEKRMQEQQASDEALLEQTSDALRAEWGTEFPRNRNLIRGLLETAPPEVKELLEGARLSNGQPVFSNVHAVKAFAQWARQINPVTTVVPGAGANVASAINDELKQMNAWMAAPKGSTDWKKYWKSDETQKRYRELIDAQARAK